MMKAILGSALGGLAAGASRARRFSSRPQHGACRSMGDAGGGGAACLDCCRYAWPERRDNQCADAGAMRAAAGSLAASLVRGRARGGGSHVCQHAWRLQRIGAGRCAHGGVPRIGHRHRTRGSHTDEYVRARSSGLSTGNRAPRRRHGNRPMSKSARGRRPRSSSAAARAQAQASAPSPAARRARSSAPRSAAARRRFTKSRNVANAIRTTTPGRRGTRSGAFCGFLVYVARRGADTAAEHRRTARDDAARRMRDSPKSTHRGNMGRTRCLLVITLALVCGSFAAQQ